MTLKQIEAFYWAATLASFSLAAERLCLSQSSLSKRLGELETQLGKILFDRSGHRAVLTTAGQTLLPQARKLLRVADEVRPEPAVRGPHGRVHQHRHRSIVPHPARVVARGAMR